MEKGEAQHLTALNIYLFGAISDMSLKFVIFRHMKGGCEKNRILDFRFIVMNCGLLCQSEFLLFFFKFA